jgi:hypothetical protein
MKAIYKYEIEHGKHPLFLPKDAKIVAVNSQKAAYFGAGIDEELVYIWAEIDTTAKLEKRVFTLYATGQDIDSEHEIYVGTAFLHDRELVFHIYEATL